MTMNSAAQPASYEQTLIRIVRALPRYQQTQLLDFAILLQSRLIATSEAKPIEYQAGKLKSEKIQEVIAKIVAMLNA